LPENFTKELEGKCIESAEIRFGRIGNMVIVGLAL
jgi:hypothetical protein